MYDIFFLFVVCYDFSKITINQNQLILSDGIINDSRTLHNSSTGVFHKHPSVNDGSSDARDNNSFPFSDVKI